MPPEISAVPWAAILDVLPASLYVVDRDLRVVAWNSPREHGPLDIPRGDAVGRLLKDLLTPEGFLAAFAGISVVFDAGIGSEEIIESDRGARVFHVRRLPIRCGHDVTHVLSWLEEVTDRRRAEEALAESERSYRRFVESLNERYFTEATPICGNIIAIFAYRSSAALNGRQELEAITERMGLRGADAEARASRPMASTGVRHVLPGGERNGWVPALVEVPDTSA